MTEEDDDLLNPERLSALEQRDKEAEERREERETRGTVNPNATAGAGRGTPIKKDNTSKLPEEIDEGQLVLRGGGNIKVIGQGNYWVISDDDKENIPNEDVIEEPEVITPFGFYESPSNPGSVIMSSFGDVIMNPSDVSSIASIGSRGNTWSVVLGDIFYFEATVNASTGGVSAVTLKKSQLGWEGFPNPAEYSGENNNKCFCVVAKAITPSSLNEGAFGTPLTSGIFLAQKATTHLGFMRVCLNNKATTFFISVPGGA